MIQHFHTFLAWLERQPRPLAALLALGLLALVTVIDGLTGTRFSLSALYVVPIGIAAWRGGRRPALALVLAATLAQGLLNPHSVRADASFMLVLWNFGMLALPFLAFALVTREARRLLEHQRTLARTDVITGVRNRVAFLTEVDQEISRALRHGKPVTLVYLDIDDFAAINSRLGHREGDRLLASVGQTLQQTIRGIDTVARLGGDDFVILLPNADSEAAAVVAPRIRDTLIARMKQDLWPVSFSMGVLTCTIPPASAEQLLQRGDELMRRARFSGKDRLVFSVQSA